MMLEGESRLGRFFASVTSKKQLLTCAVTRSVDLYCNQEDGESYSLVVSQTPTGAGDCFCYIKNNADKDMIISSAKFYAATAEIISFRLNDTGTPSGGSAATPINRKSGCGNAADVLCETGNDITGLSGGDEVESISVKAAGASDRIPWDSGLIIPKNHTLTIYATTGAIAVRLTLSMHFCECM